MKKITLFLLMIIASINFSYGQANLILEAPLDNSTTQVRAPNGLATSAYMRACALVLQTELTALPINSTLSLFGFTIAPTTTMTIPVSGNFTVYLENTTDIAYNKGTTWGTIPGPMTSVFANVMTIPLSTTATSIILTLSTPFVYTGGGIYVAYDWYSAGPFSTSPTTYFAENGTNLTPGCASGSAAGAAPTTLGTTAFRPSFLFGTINPYSNDIQIVGLESPGRINASFNTPHFIKAVVRNSSNITQNNINVNLNVSGANLFAGTQTISSLAAGISTVVTFSAFNPQILGANTVSVSVPSDQNNANNVSLYSQSVTCNEWSQNPATGTYTSNAIGFGLGSGILITPFLNPVTSNLVGIRGAVSNNATNAGNSVYAALLSSAGIVLATSNTVVLGSTSGFQTFTFAAAQSLAANTTYYLGFAQIVPFNAVAYYPAGTRASLYLPPNLYYSTLLTGGAFTPIAQNYGYFGLEALFMNNIGITATSSSTAICAGASVTLSSTGAPTYTWSTGSSNQNITVTPATNTVYAVVGTNTMGCPVSTLVTILVSPLPVTILSSTNSVCLGSLVSFTAGGAISYTYTDGSSTLPVLPTMNMFTHNPLLTTTYLVTGSNNAGCTNTANVIVIVNTFTSMNAPATASICLGATFTLNASSAITYTWNTGSTTVNTSSIVSSPLASGVFTVLGTNAIGCVDTKMVNVTVNSFTPGISSSTAICLGQQISISASGGAGISYTWSTGFNGFATLSGLTPTINTIYSVISIGQNGCAGTNSMTVTVNPNPTVTASAQRTVMCKGETNTLTASGAATYSWSTNSTNTLVVITPTSNITYNYLLTGFSSAGCTNTTLVSVNVTNCTGLNENKKNEFVVNTFPNPFTGIIHVTLESVAQPTSVKIYNALGSLVKQQVVVSEDTAIDLQNEANGLYFVYLLQDNKVVHVSKLVKH